MGRNGVFVIEMEGALCINYEWLTVVELNLAYWDGHTEDAVFDKTLRCPPGVRDGVASQPSSEGPRRRLPEPHIPPAYIPHGLDAPKSSSGAP